MNKKECDIIKDLLPSYIDNICSEASRELVAVVLATGYGMTMMLYVGLKAIGGESIFHMKQNEIGPFLFWQIAISTAVCLAVYAFQMARLYRKGNTNSVIFNLCLTGMFLMFSYYITMGNLSDATIAMLHLKRTTVITMAVGTLGTGVFALVDNKKVEKT